MEAVVVVPVSLIGEALDDLRGCLSTDLCKVGDSVDGDLCQSNDCSLCVVGRVTFSTNNTVDIEHVTLDGSDVTDSLAQYFASFAKEFVNELLDVERIKQEERLIDDLLETGRCRIVTNDIGDNELWKKL